MRFTREMISLTIVSATLATGAAVAMSSSLQATLATPPRELNPFIGSVIWRCDGMSCTTITQVNQSDTSACSDLVKALGPVTSFVSSGGEFDNGQLRTCNSTVRGR